VYQALARAMSGARYLAVRKPRNAGFMGEPRQPDRINQVTSR
jgi:hypothetical protein